MTDEKSFPDEIQIQINRQQIRNVMKKTVQNQTKIKDTREDFSNFRNALLTGLLSLIGVLLTAIVAILIIFI